MQDLISVNSQLKYGVIRLIEPRIAEVTINADVVVDMEMVLNFQHTLQQFFSAEFALLLSEKNPHSYTQEAQKYLAEIKDLKAMAVLYHYRFHDAATYYLKTVHEDANWNMKVFYGRSKAIEWLEEMLED